MKARCDSRGQSLVETALALPLLLALLAGGYWVCTHLFLAGAAESAAHAQLLRSGRGQPDIARALADTVRAGGNGVNVSGRNAPLQGSIPPFSMLAGRTFSSVDFSRPREGVGAFLDLPPHRRNASREATVDCWGGNTSSGKKVRRVVQGVVLAGALR